MEWPVKRSMSFFYRSHGNGAPFATSDMMVQQSTPSRSAAQSQGVVGSDYQTPQQKQAGVCNIPLAFTIFCLLENSTSTLGDQSLPNFMHTFMTL